LSETERWQVIRYIQTIFARPAMHDRPRDDPPADYADLTNPLALTVETLDEGKQIFTVECMVCHGDAGTGDGPYSNNMQPSPPDFSDGSYGTLSNPSYTDGDYYWRISEGLPWRAMPIWKLRYSGGGPLGSWCTISGCSLPRLRSGPRRRPRGRTLPYRGVYQAQIMPDTASFERGAARLSAELSHCHGLAGDGQGWDGQYLNPQPADLRTLAGSALTQQTEAVYMAKVTFGIQDNGHAGVGRRGCSRRNAGTTWPT
jgi:hypothetical protein